jgi:hypothetical protein
MGTLRQAKKNNQNLTIVRFQIKPASAGFFVFVDPKIGPR